MGSREDPPREARRPSTGDHHQQDLEEECEVPRGNRRRKQGNPGKGKNQEQIIKFFVSNLPEKCSSEEVKRSFGLFREVAGVYIARKKDKEGRTFGFVSFKVVTDIIALERNLRTIRMGNSKLYVNVAKFSSENEGLPPRPVRHHRTSNPSLHSKQSSHHQPHIKGKSYLDALKNNDVPPHTNNLDSSSPDLENSHASPRNSSSSEGCSATHHNPQRNLNSSPRDLNDQPHIIGVGNACGGDDSHANPIHVVKIGPHPPGNSVFYFNPGGKKSQNDKRSKKVSSSKKSSSPSIPRPKKRLRLDDDPFGLNKLLDISTES
ncbi:hypothetical protein L1987_85246 [Smallanthus sonchifolius]|uniref:Uncharacterized protein n=1 Tax=Smallanthus sonchifolius TaxID=185202 RepID=A0ACB8XVD5_9ASTR|nr:hypothetical protein L1987_85246 [Smallanthus sonchifolius]